MRLIDADKLKPDTKTFTSAYSEELTEFYSKKAINNAPTVDAEPVRHGKWITSEMTIDSGCTSCSCCRSEYYIGDLQALEGENDFVMYCPNCGTKMDGKDGESDERT